ncbi:MAG: hypothetical protein JSS34_03855 [Proteobacteria bacterium]|nr:hypothetical protein [Pseudomonadota bacterium]
MQIFLPFLLLVMCFLGSQVQISWASTSEVEPIHIESDQMNYDMKQDTAEAVGSAWAIQGDKKIEADRFIVKFQENKLSSSSLDKASKSVQEIMATGHVHIISSTEEIIGTSAIYNINTQILIVFGDNILLTSPKGSVRAHKSLSYDQKTQKVIALGNVDVIAENYAMNAPKISVHFKKTAQAHPHNSQESLILNSLKAEGGVVLKSQNYISESNQANYSALTGIVDLIGNVKITDGKNIFEGPCGEYNEKTGKSRLVTCSSNQLKDERSRVPKGRVRALLYTTAKKIP